MADISDLDFFQRSRRLFIGAIMLVLGGVVGYALPQNNAAPNSESGQILAVGDAIQNSGLWFTFLPKTNGPDLRFRLQYATAWKSSSTDEWHYAGLPTCMVPGSTMPQPATLGMVSIRGSGSAPDRKIVVWVECYT